MTDANVEFHEVGNDGDIEEEGAIQVTVGKTDIAIYRLEGELYASDDICTHAYASLAAGFQEGAEVECPLHEGRFNVKNGRALCAPITEDLKTYEVKVDNGAVFVKV